MALLVAVKSCRADLDKGFHDAIRGTWGQVLRSKGILVRFFVGHKNTDYFQAHPAASARTLQSDEVEIDAADDYNALPYKTRAICHWAFSKNIDHIFLCDTDTYVKSDKLLACNYKPYDYTGKISRPLGETFPYDAVDRNGRATHIQNCYPWASGGFGYFLSRDAAFFVADSHPKGMWAEDLWVGNLLGPEIDRGDMIAQDLPAGTYSEHFPSSKFKSGYNLSFKWMNEMHKAKQ